MDMTSVYRIENGVRKVVPYFSQMKVYAKGRWYGHTVVDVLSRELSLKRDRLQHDIEKENLYIVRTSRDGKLQTEHRGWPHVLELKLQNKDLVVYTQHRHEPDVPHDDGYYRNENFTKSPQFPNQAQTEIHIVHEDNDVMVIDKPSGIPCHPVRNYNHNTILGIIKNDTKLPFLHNCHRLDKGTSGILILAKNTDAARKYSSIIENEKKYTTKQYLARVDGDFPSHEFAIRCPVFAVNTADGRLLNSKSLQTDTTTIFRKLSYDEKLHQSIVLCTAVTGKMHQIRIHLRLLGYPIVNDSHYNNLRKPRSEVMRLKNEIELTIYNKLFVKYPIFTQKQGVSGETEHYGVSTIDLESETEYTIDPIITSLIEQLRNAKLVELSQLKLQGKVCQVCHQELYDEDRDLSEHQIWLHSYRYSYEKNSDTSMCFETALPSWCNI